MKYKLVYSEYALKKLKKMDTSVTRMILSWMKKNISDSENPYQHGKPLSANRKGQWRYRIGDYRVICLIDGNEFVVLAIDISHRKDIYI